ncbi:dienelactone hydrolase family protein [Marinobacterium sediminicola]|uniref:Dienelactone hydrolase n=1 Tax=Marinobacterium sediminicola TaxID=518898 RepID=A0ABY1S0B9_9GAMM|nr:dienelactone hydrolase family protein [Marinobacterium sediminicola]ULG70066.1 dienelactone hydrolase family protein [Marinobacterium sediminicola]SMR74522.1 Dienelactone hydrolase [Marinobacterium sediminicola]
MKNRQQTVEQSLGDNHHRHEVFKTDHATHQVLIYSTWAGITDFERNIAERLNTSGLDAVVMDFFGRHCDLSTIEARREAMLGYTRDFKAMTGHLHRLNAFVLAHTGQTTMTNSVMGFCLGGMCAMLSGLTQTGLAHAISFHGLLSFPLNAPPADPATRFMILNGLADPMVPEADIRTTERYFERHQLDLTFINFSRTQHSFMLPDANNPENGVQYNPEVAERSWHYAVDRLQRFD